MKVYEILKENEIKINKNCIHYLTRDNITNNITDNITIYLFMT